ncbi:ADP-ribosylglycohydrolase family protein [Yoonia sediminilitoris]|uniref:ADP-ribosylglycohydrolase n=1 Tax=Yoonia sediminilitoris TaxID=1286148 RepID=A0A2T6K792_9RHOB|nr:ADP-ribosylglycohydrolase family protein [Yoonia sediminilitoris]PUB10555.1 ADP-ribosylglycohydrolase [Yoonia sediminilitoris]RCW90064.1 ADP-ribosylglycohydrolase [Yoonia sediminilitoris]
MNALDDVLSRIDDIVEQIPQLLEIAPVPENRLRAILWGLAIGDALGNTSESRVPRNRFREFGKITGYLPNRHANGQRVGLPSDDTQMAFWLLEHLLGEGRLDPNLLSQVFATRTVYGMGQSVRKFRFNLASGLRWEVAGVPSAGNGAIMRIAPMLALQPHMAGADLAREIAKCAAITHNEHGAIASAVAWVHLLAALASGRQQFEPHNILQTFVRLQVGLEGPTRYRPRGGKMLGQFDGTLTEFLNLTVPEGIKKGMTTLDFGDLTYSGAFLLETLPVTIFLIGQNLEDPDRAILDAVNHTRDNDTIASLVASAMGALHGISAFRDEWKTGLLGRTSADDDGHVQALIEQVCREGVRTPYTAPP